MKTVKVAANGYGVIGKRMCKPLKSLLSGYQSGWTIEMVPCRYKARRQRITALIFWFVLDLSKMKNKQA